MKIHKKKSTLLGRNERPPTRIKKNKPSGEIYLIQGGPFTALIFADSSEKAESKLIEWHANNFLSEKLPKWGAAQRTIHLWKSLSKVASALFIQKGRQVMSWKNDRPGRLEEISSWKDGWLDGEGKALPSEHIHQLKQIVSDLLLEPDVLQFHLFLVPDGKLLVDWSVGTWEASATFNIDKQNVFLFAVDCDSSIDLWKEKTVPLGKGCLKVVTEFIAGLVPKKEGK